MILINRLISLFENYCYHANTYILMGNYLIDHPQAERYIIPRILAADDKTKKMVEWQWVISIALAAHK